MCIRDSSIPRASYASYAFGKYVEQVRDAEELRLHIRECNSVQALDNLTKKHYNLAPVSYTHLCDWPHDLHFAKSHKEDFVTHSTNIEGNVVANHYIDHKE